MHHSPPRRRFSWGCAQAQNNRRGRQATGDTRTRVRVISSVSLLCILNILADISWRLYHLHLIYKDTRAVQQNNPPPDDGLVDAGWLIGRPVVATRFFSVSVAGANLAIFAWESCRNPDRRPPAGLSRPPGAPVTEARAPTHTSANRRSPQPAQDRDGAAHRRRAA